MARGLPYDSDAGRAYAGTITALMTGQAYLTSSQIAAAQGPFAGYADNRKPMLKVIKRHQQSCRGAQHESLPHRCRKPPSRCGATATRTASSTATATHR